MPGPGSIDLTDFDLAPAVRGARSVTSTITRTAATAAREATYTAIGLGVLAYQRAQVRRREFERAMRDA